MIIFDLESNGLLDDMTKIHCLAMFNTTTEEFRTFEPDQIDEAVEILSKADAICGSMS